MDTDIQTSIEDRLRLLSSFLSPLGRLASVIVRRFGPHSGSQDVEATLPPAEQEEEDERPTQTTSDPLENMDALWEQYGKESDAADNELVRALGSDLDTLLIFAGLFSAVNTAFIIEAYQDLKPDPSESGGTNELLRTLIYMTNNSVPISTPTFTAPREAVVSNALFFVSLCCSLFSAFGAVLAKQWLSEYERAGEHRSPYIRGRLRHTKHLAMKDYNGEIVIQALGTVLQISLFLFFVALAQWMWNINKLVASIVIGGIGFTVVFYVVTTGISIIDRYSPFSTRVSATLRNLIFGRGLPLSSMSPSTDCVVWLRSNATTFKSVQAMADAWTCLGVAKEKIMSHADVSTTLLRAIIAGDVITSGEANGTLISTLRTLRDIGPWDSPNRDLFPSVLTDEMNTRVVSSMVQAFVRASTTRKDLFMCESIVGALPDPGFHHYHPSERLKFDAILSLAIPFPTHWITRRKVFSHVWDHLKRTPSDVIQITTEEPLQESWQWRLVDTLLSGVGSPFHWAVKDYAMAPASQLLLHLANLLGCARSAKAQQLWDNIVHRYVRFGNRIPMPIADLPAVQRGRLLLFHWLCRRSLCKDESYEKSEVIEIISRYGVDSESGERFIDLPWAGWSRPAELMGPLLHFELIMDKNDDGHVGLPMVTASFLLRLVACFCDKVIATEDEEWIVGCISGALDKYRAAVELTDSKIILKPSSTDKGDKDRVEWCRTALDRMAESFCNAVDHYCDRLSDPSPLLLVLRRCLLLIGRRLTSEDGLPLDSNIAFRSKDDKLQKYLSLREDGHEATRRTSPAEGETFDALSAGGSEEALAAVEVGDQ